MPFIRKHFEEKRNSVLDYPPIIHWHWSWFFCFVGLLIVFFSFVASNNFTSSSWTKSEPWPCCYPLSFAVASLFNLNKSLICIKRMIANPRIIYKTGSGRSMSFHAVIAWLIMKQMGAESVRLINYGSRLAMNDIRVSEWAPVVRTNDELTKTNY